MRLTTVRITDFRSVYDSTEIEIGSVTCLVGKNESGKTAILQALYRLNPLVASDTKYDAIADYPRLHFVEYEEHVQAGRQDPAVVTQATYDLDERDIEAIEAVYGSRCLIDATSQIALSKGYANELNVTGPAVDVTQALVHLVEDAGLQEGLKAQLAECKDAGSMLDILRSTAPGSDSIPALTSSLERLRDKSLSEVIFEDILSPRVPKFLYFDQYYQMKGHDNLEALKQRVASNQLHDSDRPLLGLIDLAGLKLDQLSNPNRTDALIARLEAAESRLTNKVLQYWSQNRHLRMSFDIRQANPGDPPGMTSGTNILGRVKDTKRHVTTPLGVRSQGFVWFFSFLAWYSPPACEGTTAHTTL